MEYNIEPEKRVYEDIIAKWVLIISMVTVTVIYLVLKIVLSG